MQQSFTDGLDVVFTVAAAIAALSIVLTLLLPNLELRDTVAEAQRDHEDPDTDAIRIKADTSP
ncbi:hypothetical protein GCM10029992_40920 [Glycomyces albus]